MRLAMRLHASRWWTLPAWARQGRRRSRRPRERRLRVEPAVLLGQCAQVRQLVAGPCNDSRAISRSEAPGASARARCRYWNISILLRPIAASVGTSSSRPLQHAINPFRSRCPSTQVAPICRKRINPILIKPWLHYENELAPMCRKMNDTRRVVELLAHVFAYALQLRSHTRTWCSRVRGSAPRAAGCAGKRCTLGCCFSPSPVRAAASACSSRVCSSMARCRRSPLRRYSARCSALSCSLLSPYFTRLSCAIPRSVNLSILASSQPIPHTSRSRRPSSWLAEIAQLISAEVVELGVVDLRDVDHARAVSPAWATLAIGICFELPDVLTQTTLITPASPMIGLPAKTKQDASICRS